MKRREKVSFEIRRTRFPGVGIGALEGVFFEAQGCFPGEVIEGEIRRFKGGVGEIRRMSRLHQASGYQNPRCPHVDRCGGCLTQHLPLLLQRYYKEREVLELFHQAGLHIAQYRGLFGLPQEFYYRNKMEFSFGDEVKGGTLNLGFHQRFMGNNVVSTPGCALIHSDMNLLRDYCESYFREKGTGYFHYLRREGSLRNLILRRSHYRKELLIVLVSTSDLNMEDDFLEGMLQLPTEGPIVGVVQILNDLPANAVNIQDSRLLYGRDYLVEELAGQPFMVSPLSFFQTNTRGAELLYRRLKEQIHPETRRLVDLYSGIGTISQLLATGKKELHAVEILEEAVQAGKRSAEEKGIKNINFHCGDVLKILGKIIETDSSVIVDPPRAGLHPAVIRELTEQPVQELVYLSCNPKTLTEDLKRLTVYYRIESLELIDMYPQTAHVEAIARLWRK